MAESLILSLGINALKAYSLVEIDLFQTSFLLESDRPSPLKKSPLTRKKTTNGDSMATIKGLNLSLRLT